MKKLIILLLITLPLLTKAQEDTIKLPASVAKKIVKDLVSGDSAKAILELTKQQLTATEQKVTIEDSIISVYKLKSVNYQANIDTQKERVAEWEKQYKILAKDNRKLRSKLTFTRIVAGAIIGVVTYFGYVK